GVWCSWLGVMWANARGGTIGSAPSGRQKSGRAWRAYVAPNGPPRQLGRKARRFLPSSMGRAGPDSPILNGMGLDIGAIQQSLETEGLDGGVLDDCHGWSPH